MDGLYWKTLLKSMIWGGGTTIFGNIHAAMISVVRELEKCFDVAALEVVSQNPWHGLKIGKHRSDVYICHQSVHTLLMWSHSSQDPTFTFQPMILQKSGSCTSWAVGPNKNSKNLRLEFFVHPKISWGFSTGTSWSNVTFSLGWRAKLIGLAFAADDHRLLNNRALCYAALKMWGKCQEGRGSQGYV